jgi:DNA-binding NarL/FixJ family response regulator
MRVIVGIGNRDVRAALFLALDSIESLRVVGSATSAAEIVTLCRTLHPDVAVLEQGLSDWPLAELLDAVVVPMGDGVILLVSSDDVTDVVDGYENVHLLRGFEEIAGLIQPEPA